MTMRTRRDLGFRIVAEGWRVAEFPKSLEEYPLIIETS